MTAEEKHRRLVARVKAQLAALPVEDQRIIFLELGRCGCGDLARIAVRTKPSTLAGVVIGGLLGAAFASSMSEDKKKPAPQTTALTKVGDWSGSGS